MKPMFATTENHGPTSVLEINGRLLDIIKARSTTTTGIQSAGDVVFCAGECPGIGGWVAAARTVGTGRWTLTIAEEISPASLAWMISGKEFPRAPTETSTGHGIRPGYLVRLSAPDMIVRSVSGEDITCALAEAPGSLSGTYPAAALVRIQDPGAA